MDPVKIFQLLETQKAIARAAQALKGQRASDKPQRHELLFKHNSFSMMLGMRAHTLQVQTNVVLAAYSPCKEPLAQLKPILLEDLRLETHHRGRVIYIRFIAKAVRTVGLTNIIEDSSGEVDRLSLYNTGMHADPEDLLREGDVYAVREPYYKVNMDGGYCIRVDHASDIMHVTKGHDLMPRAFIPRLLELLSAEGHKEQGNGHYKAKKFQLAIECYSRGIQACTADEPDLQADLHRNRSQANLWLGRYEKALWDANRSFECLAPGPKASSLNCKALYRAGRALYALAKYNAAQAKYQMALQLVPDDSDTLKALDEVKQRLVETTTGIYDMTATIKLNKTSAKRLNLASYVKDVAVRPAGKYGRGLFAEKNFKSGDTILVEKAFEIGLAKEVAPGAHVLLDLNSGRPLPSTQADLFYRVLEKLSNNPQLARQFLDLYNHGYKPNFKACEVDDCPIIDSFEVLVTVLANCFGTTVSPQTVKNENEGVWLTASHINHSCDINTTHMFVGDMIILKATRDITKGDELHITYLGFNKGHVEMQRKLHSLWGFKCACAICMADGKLTTAQRESRRSLLGQIMSLCEATHGQTFVKQRTIRQIEALYAKVVETYSPALYNGLPRLDLIVLSDWIMASYHSKRDIVRSKAFSLESLRNSGIFVTVEESKVIVDRKHGSVTSHWYAVDAAMALSDCYEIERNHTVGAQFQSLARELWLLLEPSMEGFSERYRV